MNIDDINSNHPNSSNTHYDISNIDITDEVEQFLKFKDSQSSGMECLSLPQKRLSYLHKLKLY